MIDRILSSGGDHGSGGSDKTLKGTPLRPCKYPGCRKLSHNGCYCEEHQKKKVRDYDRQRGTPPERGYDSNWQKVRKMKIDTNPLCERCKKKGRVVVAKLVHHKDRNPRNNSQENLESLCVPCHEEEHKEERRGKA